MRRLLLALLFPLLLIAQQGAFVHALEHFSAAAGTSKSPDGQSSSDQYCEKCFTFAQVGAAADLTVAFAPLLAACFEAIGWQLPIALLSDLLPPRNRGPPSPL